MAYLDTSILGSYYCPERLSDAVNRAVGGISEAVIGPVVEVEFTSLLSLKVRSGTLDRVGARAALGAFQGHKDDGLYRMVGTGDEEYAMARGWLGRFDTPLRTLDALHLATARRHRQEMLTTDKALERAARVIGVRCVLIG